jgi:DNA-binding response OmpR family regulator
MKILICDDDPAVVSVIRFKLVREELGDFIVATDGREALSLLNDNSFDLILTDIHMPYHSGLELVTYVRQTLKQSTPILILSTEGLEETVLQAFELGADDYVSKPFSLPELALRVKRLVKK